MQITEVRVYLEDRDDLRAYASITLDDCWMIRDLRIRRNGSGDLYVAMPSKKQHDAKKIAQRENLKS
jgi:stage V sporulation protein G